MRFWKKEYNYKIIDDTISEKDLQEFLRKNYIHMDIVDKPEKFADYIIKYPEIGQTFVSEVKSYNFEF